MKGLWTLDTTRSVGNQIFLVSGVTVTVYLAGTTTKADIFDSGGAAKLNPFTVSGSEVSFYAETGSLYDVKLEASDLSRTLVGQSVSFPSTDVGFAGLNSGGLFVSGNEAATTFDTSETFEKIVATSSDLGVNNGFTSSSAELTLSENGRPGLYLVLLSMCMTATGNNQIIRVRIGKNDVALAQSCARVTMAGTGSLEREESVSLHTLVTLEKLDTLQAFIGNWTSTSSVTVRNLQLSAIRLGDTA